MVGGKHAPMAAQADTGAKDKSTPVTPCPCKGPGCSQAPQSPIVPPAPPPSITFTDWACFVAKTIEQGVDLLPDGLFDDSILSPIHRANSIYHPPRLSA